MAGSDEHKARRMSGAVSGRAKDYAARILHMSPAHST